MWWNYLEKHAPLRLVAVAEVSGRQQRTVTSEADCTGRVHASARTHFDTFLAFTDRMCLRRVYTSLRSYLWAIYVRGVSYRVFHN
jgi:hypothetical protein